MATMKRNFSEEWRLKGNEIYTTAQEEGVAVTLKKERLVDALKHYYKAYQAAETDEEKASSAKNLGLSNWRIVPAQVTIDPRMSLVQYYYKEAITYFDKARICGAKSKDFEWQAKTQEHLKNCFEEAIEYHNDLQYNERIGYSEQYINCLSDDCADFKAECYINLGTLVFHHGITQLYNGFHKVALSCMKECHRPIEEARRLAGSNKDIEREANVLEADCYTHMCTAESLQARIIGDRLLHEALTSDEIVLMTGVFDAMDWFRQAIILTRESEIEMEAIAHSRLGVIYDKVIKRKDKAHDYFKRAIDLAATLQPRNFANEEWFQKATEALQRYQQETVKQEDEEWNKHRVKFIDELETELKSLVKADKEHTFNDVAFMKFVYKTFPPKNESHKMGDEDKLSEKAMLKSIVIHYHPDRQKKYGEKWLVLCEEIAKILTRRYETKKGE